jgi:hypothetical protein
MLLYFILFLVLVFPIVYLNKPNSVLGGLLGPTLLFIVIICLNFYRAIQRKELKKHPTGEQQKNSTILKIIYFVLFTELIILIINNPLAGFPSL